METLRQVWVQNFMADRRELIWRENDGIPPSGRYIGSPCDTKMRFAYKGVTAWNGYSPHDGRATPADAAGEESSQGYVAYGRDETSRRRRGGPAREEFRQD